MPTVGTRMRGHGMNTPQHGNIPSDGRTWRSAPTFGSRFAPFGIIAVFHARPAGGFENRPYDRPHTPPGTRQRAPTADIFHPNGHAAACPYGRPPTPGDWPLGNANDGRRAQGAASRPGPDETSPHRHRRNRAGPSPWWASPPVRSSRLQETEPWCGFA